MSVSSEADHRSFAAALPAACAGSHLLTQRLSRLKRLILAFGPNEVKRLDQEIVRTYTLVERTSERRRTKTVRHAGSHSLTVSHFERRTNQPTNRNQQTFVNVRGDRRDAPHQPHRRTTPMMMILVVGLVGWLFAHRACRRSVGNLSVGALLATGNNE